MPKLTREQRSKKMKEAWKRRREKETAERVAKQKPLKEMFEPIEEEKETR